MDTLLPEPPVAARHDYPVLSSPYDVAPDVAGLKTVFVNLFFIGEPGPGNPWVLVDAGLAGFASQIRAKAEALFGPQNPPRAIVLTHGHGDHVGSLADLLRHWPVPVYAHPLEMPYLRGQSAYPPPDPAIGGGGMTLLSWLFPLGPINVGEHLHLIPPGGHIPKLPGWVAVFTPGHAPGHVSLFRESDRTLLAGDAFVTTNQNSVTAVMRQTEEFHGPPAYFTCDWDAARRSVARLAELNPLAVGTGHGVAVRGYELQIKLRHLADHFEMQSIPSAGRYVAQPAVTDENGIVSMPAPVSYRVAQVLGWGLLAGLAWAGLRALVRR
jgi:glyoxylase-like metal-dependent hydrolase (beta-lactamase superfamily II)